MLCCICSIEHWRQKVDFSEKQCWQGRSCSRAAAVVDSRDGQIDGGWDEMKPKRSTALWQSSSLQAREQGRPFIMPDQVGSLYRCWLPSKPRRPSLFPRSPAHTVTTDAVPFISPCTLPRLQDDEEYNGPRTRNTYHFIHLGLLTYPFFLASAINT